MDDLILEIGKWQIETFGKKETLFGAANHLLEEATETAVAACEWVEQSYFDGMKETSKEHLHEEIADVFIMLCAVSRLSRCDLRAEVEKKMAKNKKRKWKKPDENGVISHLEEKTA